MNKVTLGGERLGSGKKMDVELHGFERSTHDMGYIWRSTMAAGTLVPFMSELALPGDTFDIHLNCDIKTHPTIGPLFGSYKVQLDVFLAPIRLYNSGLHNNMLYIGNNMQQIKLPKYKLLARPVGINTPDLDNAQINPSSIFSYLGVRGVGIVNPVEGLSEAQYRKFNAIPWLAYWDIYKNYYANKQEERGYVIAQRIPDVSVVPDTVYIGDVEIMAGGGLFIPLNNNVTVGYTGTSLDVDSVIIVFMNGWRVSLRDIVNNEYIDNGAFVTGQFNWQRYGGQIITRWEMFNQNNIAAQAPYLQVFPLADIDNMRNEILQSGWQLEFILNDANGGLGLPPYSYALRVVDLEGADYATMQSTQEGLGIKTYQSDLFNNWLSTEWIDGVGGINEITAIDTSGGSINIDTIILSKKVYDMLNRIAVSGGSYNDWLNAVYDHMPNRGAESPMYMGGLIKELVFQEVVSNSTSQGDSEQPLGTLAGKGVMGVQHKGGDVVIKVDEPAYIIGIISLTPRVDYSQGNKWDVHLDTMDDLHKPNLDEIGFQELITEQMAWWSTRKPIAVPAWETKSAGKQPAWINYMTNVNQVRGNFAISTNEMFMTLNRKYEPDQVGVDYSNYRIGDLTTYIDPAKFNNIFAQTQLDSQNFWAQISVDMTARRKMSAKVMPNL